MATTDLPFLVPSSVLVSYPILNGSVLSGAVYPVEVTLASLALTSYNGASVFTGKKIFRDTCIAAFLTSAAQPDNLAELTTLTTQIARDWYLNQLGLSVKGFAEIVPWIPSGVDESVEWDFSTNHPLTRIHRGPFNDRSEELFHCGTYGCAQWGASSGPILICCPIVPPPEPCCIPVPCGPCPALALPCTFLLSVGYMGNPCCTPLSGDWILYKVDNCTWQTTTIFSQQGACGGFFGPTWAIKIVGNLAILYAAGVPVSQYTILDCSAPFVFPTSKGWPFNCPGCTGLGCPPPAQFLSAIPGSICPPPVDTTCVTACPIICTECPCIYSQYLLALPASPGFTFTGLNLGNTLLTQSVNCTWTNPVFPGVLTRLGGVFTLTASVPGSGGGGGLSCPYCASGLTPTNITFTIAGAGCLADITDSWNLTQQPSIGSSCVFSQNKVVSGRSVFAQLYFSTIGGKIILQFSTNLGFVNYEVVSGPPIDCCTPITLTKTLAKCKVNTGLLPTADNTVDVTFVGCTSGGSTDCSIIYASDPVTCCASPVILNRKSTTCSGPLTLTMTGQNLCDNCFLSGGSAPGDCCAAVIPTPVYAHWTTTGSPTTNCTCFPTSGTLPLVWNGVTGVGAVWTGSTHLLACSDSVENPGTDVYLGMILQCNGGSTIDDLELDVNFNETPPGPCQYTANATPTHFGPSPDCGPPVDLQFDLSMADSNPGSESNCGCNGASSSTFGIKVIILSTP